MAELSPAVDRTWAADWVRYLEALGVPEAPSGPRRGFPADELWLVIQCTSRISKAMLDILGVEDFEAVPSRRRGRSRQRRSICVQ
jgi:hypothetical protein